jgi:hypothetical protein
VRGLRVAVLLSAVGSALVLVAVSRHWLTWDIDALTINGLHEARTGRQVVPGVAALGWAGLAGVLALVVTKSWGRRVVGVALCVVGALVMLKTADWVMSKKVVTVSIAGRPFLGLRVSRAWPLVAFAGGLGVVASGALAAVRGHRWAGLGSSYEAPVARPVETTTEKGVWDALDRGDDPTA